MNPNGYQFSHESNNANRTGNGFNPVARNDTTNINCRFSEGTSSGQVNRANNTTTNPPRPQQSMNGPSLYGNSARYIQNIRRGNFIANGNGFGYIQLPREFGGNRFYALNGSHNWQSPQNNFGQIRDLPTTSNHFQMASESFEAFRITYQIQKLQVTSDGILPVEEPLRFEAPLQIFQGSYRAYEEAHEARLRATGGQNGGSPRNPIQPSVPSRPVIESIPPPPPPPQEPSRVTQTSQRPPSQLQLGQHPLDRYLSYRSFMNERNSRLAANFARNGNSSARGTTNEIQNDRKDEGVAGSSLKSNPGQHPMINRSSAEGIPTCSIHGPGLGGNQTRGLVPPFVNPQQGPSRRSHVGTQQVPQNFQNHGSRNMGGSQAEAGPAAKRLKRQDEVSGCQMNSERNVPGDQLNRLGRTGMGDCDADFRRRKMGSLNVPFVASQLVHLSSASSNDQANVSNQLHSQNKCEESESDDEDSDCSINPLIIDEDYSNENF